MSKYRKFSEVPYYMVDKNKIIKPVYILNLLGEASGEHSIFNVGEVDKVESLNYAWMLNRWKLKIEKYPMVREKIIIETWTSNIDRFYANREFLIYDENEKEIGRASTLWILVDIKNKRPVRISNKLKDMYKIVDEKAFNDFHNFKEKINININEYKDFYVRRSDIDYNNHVNNAIYLDWIVESIPEEIYNNYVLREFEILYKKEITYGDIILSGTCERCYKDNIVEFYHTIINKNTNENHALAITKWK